MMPDLIGLTSILLIFLLTIIVSIRWPSISQILLCAFFLRILFIFIGHYITPLPDSTADASSFERLAWFYAKDGFVNVFNFYRGPDSSFISWVIAIFYSLFGRSLLLAQSISLFFGMGVVLLGWLLAKKIWDDHSARKVGWILALFPSLILYSVLILREVYIIFFLLIAIWGIVDWSKTDNYRPLLVATIGFIGATFFHGGMIIGGICFFIIVGIKVFIRTFKTLMSFYIHTKSFVLSIFIIFGLSYYLSGNIAFPKLGTFQEATSLERVTNYAKITTRSSKDKDDGASYPKWIKINSSIELIYKGPIRVIFFIFSPFPWQVKKTSHLLGVMDSFFYMALVFLAFQNRKVIWQDPALRIILIIFTSYLLVFGVMVGNFGTSIRHRLKFVTFLILLVAPCIPKISFKNNDKNKLIK